MKFKRIAIAFSFILLCLFTEISNAQKATWIWYPGDFDIWLGINMQNRREDRASFTPPFWKMDTHYLLVEFHKDIDMTQPETAEIFVEGKYSVKVDGKQLPGYPKNISLTAGKHTINIKVFCRETVPAIFVSGKQFFSDSSWLVTNDNKDWNERYGKISNPWLASWTHAGSWNFNAAATPPSKFVLSTQPQSAVAIEKKPKSLLLDFGKETFGFVKLHGLKGNGTVSVYYGESKEEAMSPAFCETFDKLDISFAEKKDTLSSSKAFRYVQIVLENGVTLDSASMLYEYASVKDKGNFKCSDTLINRIYEVAKYTFHLNTREFFIDGIKRDRWIWSGDAYQSYLMNYYLLFDSPTVTRTMLALRGKDPVTNHINSIMDYTFYWFISIYDYYQYTGDKTFVQQFYPRMKSMMDFCLSRRNDNGMMEGKPGDWLFIDWAEGLSKKGEVSFEQMLFARSLETMAISAEIVKDTANEENYKKLAADLKAKIFKNYWNDEKHALVHSRENDRPTETVTRYANMFGIFFDYFSDAQKQDVKQHVLLNDSIQKITTPYMRFYELEALCAMGEQTMVLKEIKDYWGGMLKEGATTFWEEFDPTKKGTEHLAMYGRPYGKSLCHAWGASPLYLLGKYYIGIKPTSPGYATYLVEPKLGGLKWMEGTVPTPKGEIKVYCSTSEIRVKGTEGTGVLRFKSKTKPVCTNGPIKLLSNNVYEITMVEGKDYLVKYLL